MTRPIIRNGLAEQAARGVRKLEDTGFMKRPPLHGPGTTGSRTPGTTLWRVRIVADGRRRTRAEAAATFAHQPWARRAVDRGASGGFYCWEVPE